MGVVDLYDHQKMAVDELRNGSILVGGVGTGKSRTSLAYYFTKVCGGGIGESYLPMTKPLDLYIITTARKRDTKEWESEMVPFLLYPYDVRKERYNINIEVDSWNNVEKFVDVEGAFFIFDEQRVVGSGKWAKSFIKIAKKNKWILLSATPGDTWSDYISVFIANGFFKNKTEFTRKHCVFNRFSKYPKIDRYVDTDILVKYRDRIIVNMEYMKKTIPHRSVIFTPYDQDLMKMVWEERWNVFESRPIKDMAECCLCMRKIVNSEPSRLYEVTKLLKRHPKAIIFYNFDYELELLRGLAEKLSYSYAEWNGHKHEAVPRSDAWIYLVQYAAGAEGWNCVTTDTIIFYSQNYSYKIMTQAAGRIDRLNTSYTDLYYYTLSSTSHIDKSIARALKNKKTFNEKTLLNAKAPKVWKEENLFDF